MRLRTLPLSTAGIVLGIFMACKGHQDRSGPQYSMQEGGLTEDDMRSCIRIMVLVCCIFGLGMIRASFKTIFCIESESLIVLGAAAIWAAMHYTLGKKPYGYRGLGDLFVFIFFGLVPVTGGYFVCAHAIEPTTLIPGAAIGLFSVGVLNVNNIRDMKTDAANRVTVPLKLGEHRAKIYHTILITGGWILMLLFTILFTAGWTPYLYIITLPLYAKHLAGVWKRSGRELDPMLPMLVISTFIFALLAGTGYILQ